MNLEDLIAEGVVYALGIASTIWLAVPVAKAIIGGV